MTDAEQLRAAIERDSSAWFTIGGGGYPVTTLLRVLDRLDELEWIVSVMRGKTPVSPPEEGEE